MKLSAFVLSALLGAGFVAPAVAGPREGAQEIQAAASFFRPIGTGAGTFNADASYGYFINPMIQVGIRQGYTLNHNDDVPDTWNAVTTPFLNLHFAGWIPDQRFVPFLGGFVGGVWNDDDGTGTVGPEGGIKFYFSDDSFLAARYRYEWFFDELDTPDRQDANHVAVLALGYQWGGTSDATMSR